MSDVGLWQYQVSYQATTLDTTRPQVRTAHPLSCAPGQAHPLLGLLLQLDAELFDVCATQPDELRGVTFRLANDSFAFFDMCVVVEKRSPKW